jgi:hypothetical protein
MLFSVGKKHNLLIQHLPVACPVKGCLGAYWTGVSVASEDGYNIQVTISNCLREVSKNDNEACLEINTGVGFYLLCSTISEKHSMCIVCPQLRTLVPCNESNRYCRPSSSYNF